MDKRANAILNLHRILIMIILVCAVIILYTGRNVARFNLGESLIDYVLCIALLVNLVLFFEYFIYEDTLAGDIIPVAGLTLLVSSLIKMI